MLFNAIQFGINFESLVQAAGSENAGLLMTGDAQQAFGSLFAEQMNLMLNGESTATGNGVSPMAGLLAQLKAGKSLSVSDLAGARGFLAGLAMGKEAAEFSEAESLLELLMGMNGADSGEGKDVSALMEKLMGSLSESMDSEGLLALAEGLFADELTSVQGQDWIKQFKAMLDASGQDLSSLSLDENGLEALKELLVQAGFSREEIQGLFIDLTEDPDNGTISLTALFEGIEKLEPEASEEDGADALDLMLPASMVPVLDSLLASFGIPEDIRSDLMKEAGQTERGIGLRKFVTTLQMFQQQLFLSGNSLTVENQDSALKSLLGQLGLADSYRGEGEFTFESFISSLETLRNSIKTLAVDGVDTSVSEGAEFPSGSLFASGTTVSESVVLSAHYRRAERFSETRSLVSTVLSGLDASGTMIEDGETSGLETQTEFTYNFLKSTVSKNSLSLTAYLSRQLENGSDTSAGSGTQTSELTALLEKLAGTFSRTGLQESLDSAGSGKETLVGSGKEAKTDQSGQELSTATSGMLKWSSAGAASTPSPRPAAPALPAHVTNQVSKRLIQSINRGDSQLRLQLKPPELGRLLLTIDHQSTGIKVSVITENHATRDILLSQVNELKASLAGSGISLESFDVDMGDDFQQSMADARYQSGGSGNGRRFGSRGGASSEPDITAGDLPATELASGSTAIHFVA